MTSVTIRPHLNFSPCHKADLSTTNVCENIVIFLFLVDFDEVVLGLFSYIFSLAMLYFLSTILEEEKLQQEERLRMEMRRQVTVSWDSGGSDEAPPKVGFNDCLFEPDQTRFN